MTIKRKIFDCLRNVMTAFSFFIALIVLVSIIFYVVKTGAKTLSFKFLFSDNAESLNLIETKQNGETFTDPAIEDTYFSEKYGIGLIDSFTPDGTPCVMINYIASSSPFKSLKIINSNNTIKVEKGEIIDVLIGKDVKDKDIMSNAKKGAQKMATALDSAYTISYLQCKKTGGGIRGSLIATLYLILLTLLFVLPLGIGAAIYLTLYAKEGKFKSLITNMIDATSGVPSIIFGFVGMIVFIPFVSLFTGKSDYSILAGALTMTIVLLPVVIKTTSEALISIPSHYMSSSLALGATKSQTIFKIILPASLPGILTSALLCIGRIIGESAALIFVMGSSIKDNINIFQGATSISLHIWSITRADKPNYEAACAISIIILLVVFLLNVIVKIISYKINKKRGA